MILVSYKRGIFVFILLFSSILFNNVFAQECITCEGNKIDDVCCNSNEILNLDSKTCELNTGECRKYFPDIPKALCEKNNLGITNCDDVVSGLNYIVGSCSEEIALDYDVRGLNCQNKNFEQTLRIAKHGYSSETCYDWIKIDSRVDSNDGVGKVSAYINSPGVYAVVYDQENCLASGKIDSCENEICPKEFNGEQGYCINIKNKGYSWYTNKAVYDSNGKCETLFGDYAVAYYGKDSCGFSSEGACCIPNSEPFKGWKFFNELNDQEINKCKIETSSKYKNAEIDEESFCKPSFGREVKRFFEVSRKAVAVQEHSNGKTYAYTVGGKFGILDRNIPNWPGNDPLSIFDVSIPENAQKIGQYTQLPDPSDIYVKGNYLYITDRLAGLVVIDVNNPSNPQRVSQQRTNGNARDIYVQGNYAYITLEENGLAIVAISNPSELRTIGTYNPSGDNTAISVFVLDKYAYVTFNNVNKKSVLQIIDVSNPSSPRFISESEISSLGNKIEVVENNNARYAYIADWGVGGVTKVDVTNPLNPISSKSITLGNVKPMGIDVSDGLMFLTASQESGFFAGPLGENGYLAVFDDLNDPKMTDLSYMNFYALDIEVLGDYAYVTFGSSHDRGGFVIYKVSKCPKVTNPVLSVVPDSLEFSCIKGDKVIMPKTLSIINKGNGKLYWTASASSQNSWLSIDKLNGITEDRNELEVSALCQNEGIYSGNVKVVGRRDSQSGNVIGEEDIPVKLIVNLPLCPNAGENNYAGCIKTNLVEESYIQDNSYSCINQENKCYRCDTENGFLWNSQKQKCEGPGMITIPEKLIFSCKEGDNNIPSQALNIINTGTGKLYWTASASSQNSWLSIDKLNGITEDRNELEVSALCQNEGIYSGNVKVVGRRGNVNGAIVAENDIPTMLTVSNCKGSVSASQNYFEDYGKAPLKSSTINWNVENCQQASICVREGFGLRLGNEAKTFAGYISGHGSQKADWIKCGNNYVFTLYSSNVCSGTQLSSTTVFRTCYNPLNVSCSANMKQALVGESVEFAREANYFTGKPPITYKWSDGSVLDQKQVICKSAGVITETITATDSGTKDEQRMTKSSSCSVNCVEPFSFDLIYTGSSQVIGPSVAYITKNENITYKIFPFGGTKPYSFNWRLIGLDGKNASEVCSPSNGKLAMNTSASNNDLKIKCSSIGIYRLLVDGIDNSEPKLKDSKTDTIIIYNEPPRVSLRVDPKLPKGQGYCSEQITIKGEAIDFDGGIKQIVVKFNGNELCRNVVNNPEEKLGCQGIVNLQEVNNEDYEVIAEAIDSDGEKNIVRDVLIRKCPMLPISVSCRPKNALATYDTSKDKLVAFLEASATSDQQVSYSWKAEGALNIIKESENSVFIEYPSELKPGLYYKVNVTAKNQNGDVATDTCKVYPTVGSSGIIGQINCAYNRYLTKLTTLGTIVVCDCKDYGGCNLESVTPSCNIQPPSDVCYY